jgi:CubicO group peptidase (beta-lactamase class C family)
VTNAEPVQPEADPGEVGLSAPRLARITAGLAERVARGEIPAAVAVICRAGRVAWVAAAGGATPSSIFRIYSMSKPLLSVAALALAEDGLLDLTDPVDRYLPELAGLPVVAGHRDAEATGGPGDGVIVTVPAQRPMSVHDLLRHTSGFCGGYHGSPLITAAYQRAGIAAFDHTRQMAEEICCADLVSALAKVPLAHQPGTVWEYGRSGDVLGRVLEIAAGQPLDAIMAERVCAPVGMADTGFFVPAESLHRVVHPLTPFVPGTDLITFTQTPAFLSGGSGCYSTAADYLRFARMILAGGALDGQRVVSGKSVALMTADHLGPAVDTGPDYIPGAGYGFGLGFAVRHGDGMAATLGSAGDVWWLGRAATCFFADPREEIAAVLMTQRYWEARRYQSWFKNLTYQAIVG